METTELFDCSESPALEIAGFRVWTDGRQFPNSADSWDDSWLYVTAQVETVGASVNTSGPFVSLGAIARWAMQCEQLHAGQVQEAVFSSDEPELTVTIRRNGRLGHMAMRVEITPAILSQGHWFEFDIDQSYLPLIVSQCRAIVREYSVRGHES